MTFSQHTLMLLGSLFLMTHLVLSTYFFFLKKWGTWREVIFAVINPFYFLIKGFRMLAFMPSFFDKMTMREYIDKLNAKARKTP
jgi:hypothetical protein